MAVETPASTSVKDYLRRYETKSKQSKKKNKKTQPCALGFLVVDDDPVWQKPINLREEYEDDLADNKRKISEIADMPDISVPRRVRHFSPNQYVLGASPEADLSPPTKNRKNSRTPGSLNASSQHSFRYSTEKGASRVSKDELLRSQKGQEKPKEKKLEWGKGLAQKRDAETRQRELEFEKDRPFARTRDDPELERMLKERIRWGDPMADLVKKYSEPDLPDLGDSRKMRESGFVIPQDVSSHSWIKREVVAPQNRYGIRPGRHWDGVDRSRSWFTSTSSVFIQS